MPPTLNSRCCCMWHQADAMCTGHDVRHVKLTNALLYSMATWQNGDKIHQQDECDAG